MVRARRYWWWLIGGCLLLAYALRVYHLDHFSFWLDEGLTPLRSGYPLGRILSNEIILQGEVTKDTHPPLYYLLIHGLRALLGSSDFALRYPSTLWGVLLVPVLARLGRQLGGPLTGVLAALLAAINPLLVWYGQEARMYTLLVLLGAAAGTVQWQTLRAAARGELGNRDLARRLGWYGLWAGLAFYTHYTAAFLVAGQSLLWLRLLWRRGWRRQLLAAAALAGLAALPLVPVTIPRLFTGAEASYSYVPPWIMLQDVVRGFGFGRTAPTNPALVTASALALIIVLAAAVWPGRPSTTVRRERRTFLLVYLLATVAGIALISPLKPMYLGPHHIMIGLPAFVLLLALGLQRLSRTAARLPAAVRPGVPLLAAALVVAGAGLSLARLYGDYRVAKEDYRGLTAYVDRAAGSADVLVYNNATLLPVQWHYQTRPDVPVTALPIYPHPVREQTFRELDALNAHYERIWFMPEAPQAGRDRHAEVRGWLDANLLLVGDRSFFGNNAEVRVLAYRTGVVSAEFLPPDAVPLAWQGDGLPPLHGVRLADAQPLTGPAVWLDLYWEAPARAAPQRGVHFALRGPDGRDWVSQDHALWFGAAPPVGGPLLRGSYHLPLPPGLPPGQYDLVVRAWDAAAHQTVGDGVVALPVTVGARAQTLRAVADSRLTFANGLELAPVPASDTVRPGVPLPITLYWRAAQPLTAPWTVRVEALARDGTRISAEEHALQPGWLGDVPAGSVIGVPAGINFPAGTAPQPVTLRWTVFHGETTLRGRPSWRPWSASANRLGRVTVTPWPLVTQLPAVDNFVESVDSRWGNVVNLRGYAVENAGDNLIVTLVWQADGPLDAGYRTFVHLVPAASDDPTPRAQSDQVPVGWLRPTDGWRAGEFLVDRHTVALPPDLPGGQYVVNVGLYRPNDGIRLPVQVGGADLPNAQLPLTTVTLP